MPIHWRFRIWRKNTELNRGTKFRGGRDMQAIHDGIETMRQMQFPGELFDKFGPLH